MLEALFFIVLSIALGDSDSVVDIVQPHGIVGHIPDRAGAAASFQIVRLLAEGVRPYLDSGALGRVVHRHVADEDVLHNINALRILPERSDRYAVCTVT